MKRIALLVSGCLFLSLSVTGKESAPIKKEAPHVVTLFMEPIDITGLQPDLEQLQKKLEKPTKMTRTIFKQKFSPENSTNQGVNITHAGAVKTLGPNGQIFFPRRHTQDEALIIVTRKIRPIIIRGNTVEYFVRDKKEPTEYYQIKRHFNKAGNFHYWETKKIAPPKNKKIPTSAFVIFAKPSHIRIPEGKTLAMKGPNLLLPPIYPTKQLSRDLNALSFLKINHYFAPVKFKLKRAAKRYAQMIQL